MARTRVPKLHQRVCRYCGKKGTRGLDPVQPRAGEPWNVGLCRLSISCANRAGRRRS